jgi:hypothetical protein
MKAGEGGIEQTEERPAIGVLGFVTLCGRVVVKRDRHAPVVGADVRRDVILGRCEDYTGEFVGCPSQSFDEEAPPYQGLQRPPQGVSRTVGTVQISVMSDDQNTADGLDLQFWKATYQVS